MRQSLPISLHPVLNQPDCRDVGDGLNKDPVLLFSETRRGDMETCYNVSSRIPDDLYHAPEKTSFISLNAGPSLAIFSRVVQNHLTRLQYLCATWSHGNCRISPGPTANTITIMQ
jgi:hypothetical protein